MALLRSDPRGDRRQRWLSGQSRFPLLAFGELPQRKTLILVGPRLVDVKPMLTAVNNASLVCCGNQSGRWYKHVVPWPDGLCGDGVSLHREAVGKLIVDLTLSATVQAPNWCFASLGTPPHGAFSTTCLLYTSPSPRD